MHHPHITFRKSKKKDFETVFAFSKEAIYDNGRCLNWAILDKYSILKNQFDKNYKIKSKKEIMSFIKKIYSDKKDDMDHALKQHKERWNKVNNNFFELTDQLFGDHKWPDGKYISFGTIWGMYPRYLNDKTFQIPYWHKIPLYVSVVIAHEMLHFIFYDYLLSKYPKYKNDKYDFFIWHVSEIFNSLIQNSPKWIKVFKHKSKYYPEHKKIIQLMKKERNKLNESNIDEMIKEIIKHVSTSTLIKDK